MATLPGDLTSAASWDAVWTRTRSSALRSTNPLVRLGSRLRSRVGYRGQLDETYGKLLDWAAHGRALDVLELGCAPGTMLQTLHRLQPQHRYAGLDIAVEGLGLARRQLAADKIDATLHLGDMRDAEIGKFDLAMSFGLIEHFDDPAAAIAHHARHVRPGGYVAITVPNYAHKIVVALLAQFSPETLATHHLAIMHERAIAEAMEQAGLVEVSAGQAVGPLLPNSRASEGLSGSVYRALSRTWNAGVGLLPRELLWSGLLWGFARRPMQG